MKYTLIALLLVTTLKLACNVNADNGATIENVEPNQLQRSTVRTLKLTINHLSSSNEALSCAFTFANQSSIFTEAKRTANGVDCSTPRTELLPPIPTGKHHMTAELSVRTIDGPALASTSFTFYDCSTFESCTQCASSPFPCDWCVEGHRCTHDTAENCRNDILVTGVSRIGPSYRTGPSFCPTINATNNQSAIFIASGSRHAIKVKVHIIGQFIIQTRFVCQFNIEGRVTSINAQLLGDTIYCDAMEFKYTANSPTSTARFAVIWGGSKPLDNPDNIHVEMYKCSLMVNSCGSCLTLLSEKLECGWCQSTSTCEVADQCTGQNDWLKSAQTCPHMQTIEPLN